MHILRKDKLTIALLIIYLIGIFWIIVLKFNLPFSYKGHLRSINLIPYSESLILNGKIDFGEIILNMVIFVPLGLYAGILFHKWIFRRKIFLFFFISLLCEVSQLILGVGAFDITDIINNTLGGIVGLLIYTGIEKVLKNGVKARKIINIVALIGTILVISLIVFLKINKLWIFRMEI
jgi:glycopeptide antibiotics resistance protein